MTERILTYLFLLGSSFYVLFAQKLSFGVLSSPKAGFLPTIAGMAAIILSIGIIARGKYTVNEKVSEVNWRKFILIIAGLVFYLVCLSVAGYRAATFLIMLYLLKSMELAGWFRPILISAIVTMAFYGIFSGLLSITLP